MHIVGGHIWEEQEKKCRMRIDYFIVSNDISNKIEEAKIFPEIYGSDHCPVGLEITL